MYLEDFPACCTAKIICDFGGEESWEYEENEVENDVDDIIKWCNQKIPMLTVDGFGLVVAITTDVQKYTNEALEKLGFYHHEAEKGRNHETGKLHMWFMPTHEFVKV